MSRTIAHRYTDPIDLVWLACARDIGLTVVRSESVYAAFDGATTLTLSTREHFDADDSLAQLIFHELCHALVAGPQRLGALDWGMENTDERDLAQEHACHRVQAALADRHGLRALFAVTTDWRPYWDALPINPLAMGEDPAIGLARAAYARGTEGPWAPALERALLRTRQVAEVVRAAEPPREELWSLTRALHTSGFPVGDDASARCGGCAWSFESSGLRCRKSRGPSSVRGVRVAAEDRACVRFEGKLDVAQCGACGACCREAFHRVEIGARDPVKKRHPLLVVRDGFGDHIPRPQGRCVALDGDGEAEAYRCRIYDERPSACASFPIAGDACMDARERVGYTGRGRDIRELLARR